MWRDGRLVISPDYDTTDSHILAAGSATRLDSQSALLHSGPPLSPRAVGARLGRILLDSCKVENQVKELEEGGEEAAQFSVRREAQLPGGLSYLYLSTTADSPGSPATLSSSGEGGECRVWCGPGGGITALQAVQPGYLPNENLARLAGTNLATFPGIHHSQDIIAFLQQPRFLAVFHDRYRKFSTRIHKIDRLATNDISGSGCCDARYGVRCWAGRTAQV